MYSDLELLQHIREEVDFVLSVVGNKGHQEVLNDGTLCRAIIRSLEIIGEAAKKISEEFRYNHAEIEWKKLAGTRDKLIHDYFGIDYDIVWNIIQSKLPSLQYAVNDIFNSN